LLAVIADELQRHAANARVGIGAMRVATADRQAAQHRHLRLREHAGRTQCRAFRRALEGALHAHALGMRTAEAWMRRPGGFDAVGEGLGGGAVAADPAGQPGENQCQHAGDQRDQRDPWQRRTGGAGIAEKRHDGVPAFTMRVGGRRRDAVRKSVGRIFTFSPTFAETTDPRRGGDPWLQPKAG
jgi:hypothetical protein